MLFVLSHYPLVFTLALGVSLLFLVTVSLLLHSLGHLSLNHLTHLIFPRAIPRPPTPKKLVVKSNPQLLLSSCSFTLLFFLLLVSTTYFFYRTVPRPHLPASVTVTFEELWQELFYITDGAHYFALARFGYNNPKDQLYSLAFFPLYPFLLFLLGNLFSSLYPGAILINFLTTAFSLYFLYHLAAAEFSSKTARLTLALFLLFPVSFFLFLPHPVALFILLTILFFFHLRSERYLTASLFALAATLTRIQGFLLIAPLAYSLFQNARSLKHPPRAYLKTLALITIPLLGLLLYFLINFLHTNDPLAFLHLQAERWSQKPQPIYHTFFLQAYYALHSAFPWQVGRWGSSLFFLILAFFTLISARHHRFAAPYIIYALAYLIFSFSISNPMSGNRFLFMLWPLFLFQADFLSRHPRLALAYLALCATLLPIMWYFYVFYPNNVVC